MDYKSCSIQELIIASQKNNLDAFELIIKKYQNLAFRFTFFMTGNKNTAETITKECFTDFFDEIKFYNISRPIESWLLSSVTAKVKDLTKQTNYNEESLPEPELKQFMGSFQKLPLENKEAIIAIKLLGLTGSQAAEYINIPEKNLISRFNKGMLQLVQNE